MCAGKFNFASLIFFKIRNPWGESEWTGDYCDSSPLWTAALKKELGYEAEDDGAFFMSWEHFVMWFGGIEICDATGLKKLTEGELCRVDGFSSHWSAPDFQSAKYPLGHELYLRKTVV